MNFYLISCVLLVNMHLYAKQTTIQKYTEANNNVTTKELDSHRRELLKERSTQIDIRDYRDTMRETRLQNLYKEVRETPYR